MGRIVRVEWYRLVHGKSFLIALIVLAALIVGSNLMNSSLASLGEESLAKTMDSFTGGLPTFFMAIMAISLAQADRQAGTLKNVVSCGIPRSKVFLGKLVSAFIVTLIIIAVSGVVSYAAALATGASGTIQLADFLPSLLVQTLASLAFTCLFFVLGDIISSQGIAIFVSLALSLLDVAAYAYLGQLIGFDDLGSYAFGTIQAAGTGVQPLQIVVMAVISFVVFTIGRRLFETRDVK